MWKLETGIDNDYDRHRNEFPTLASGIHLLSHSLGPVPRAARESMLAYIDAWEHHTSEDAWATSWWELSQRVGDRIARILGGAPGSVQIQPNASIALATVASCFDFKSGDATKSSRLRSTFRRWNTSGTRSDRSARVLKLFRRATASQFRSNESLTRSTTKPVSSRLHTRRIAVLIVLMRRRLSNMRMRKARSCCWTFTSQPGVMPLYAADWNVDFLIGGTIKWLCGGPSCGYLYVRPDLQRDLRPRLTGWVAHDSPFDFAHAPMRYARSVRRFAQGTPSIPALYSAIPGLRLSKQSVLQTLPRSHNVERS